jgi:hypothetical protein
MNGEKKKKKRLTVAGKLTEGMGGRGHNKKKNEE